MELTRSEYQRLVTDVAAAVVERVLPFVKKAKRPEDECTWINPKEAADVLGITVNHLLHIKDAFTYIKMGQSRCSHVRFRKETLIEEHMKSQHSRVRIPAARKAAMQQTGQQPDQPPR